MLIALVNDSDIFGEASERTSTSATSVPTADLTSIDQLLKTVWPCQNHYLACEVIFVLCSTQYNHYFVFALLWWS